MSTVARIVFLLALIVWLGEVLFLSLVVAPTVFRNFAVEEAGRVVSLLFPIYYQIGAVCGVALLIAALILRRTSESRGSWSIGVGVIAVMLAATLYAAIFVQPRAQALRPQLHQAEVPAAIKEEFDGLHRLAVQLNSVVLLGGLAVAIITALRLKP
ncbi:MAG TPA: DUF4149 domain-containing protein [Candidatus Kryptonia bacterium]|nr:DUF4149 domain-containing protein [Candidatus Kryptonia bacterium]